MTPALKIFEFVLFKLILSIEFLDCSFW